MGLFRRRRARSSSAVPEGYEPFPAHGDAQERQWRDGIAEHGWIVLDVPGDGERPRFAYTAGLTPRGLPEVVVYGLPGEVGMHLLNDVAQRMLDGTQYADGEVVPELVDGDYRVQLWDATWLQDPLGAAFRLYGRDAVRVRQLVVPDREDRLPWEDGYADPDLQPVLFTPPDGSGPRRAGPEETDDHPVPADWDLPHDPHLGTLLSGPVATGELPVLLVVHDHDGDVQAVDGVHDPEAETAQLVCLHHVVAQDPTLRDVLRTLPLGHRARRDAVGAPWRYQPLDAED